MRLLLSISILFSSVIVQASPSDITCSDYNTQNKSSRTSYESEMRQKILNLCQQPYWQKAARQFAVSYMNFEKNFWSGFFVNFRTVFERINNHGLTAEFDTIMQYPKLNEVLNECYPGDKTAPFWFANSEIRTDQSGAVVGLYTGLAVQYLIYKKYSQYVDKAMQLPPLANCKVPLLSKYFPNAAKAVVKGALVALPYFELGMFQWAHILPDDNNDLKPVDSPEPELKSTPEVPEATAISRTDIDRDQLHQVTMQAAIQMLKYDGVATAPPKTAQLDPNSVNTTAINPLDMKPGIDVVFSRCMESITRYNSGKQSAQAKMLGTVNGPHVVTMCGTFIDMAKNAQEFLGNPEYRCTKVNDGAATDLAAAINEVAAKLPDELMSK